MINYVEQYGDEMHRQSAAKMILNEGFFARTFPVNVFDDKKVKIEKLPKGIGELSEQFSFRFENSGVMIDGVVYTTKTVPNYHGAQITLGDVMDQGDVYEKFFIPDEKLYYTYPDITHSDESLGKLPKE